MGVEDQFRVLIENALHITAILGPDRTIRYVSPAVERMLGYPPEALQGTDVLELIHPDDLPAVAERLNFRIAHPGVGQFIEFRTQHKDGSWRVLEAIATNRLRDPVIAGIVVDARDVTERKWMAERLQHALEALLAIHDVGRQLGSSLEQQAIVTALLEAALRVVPMDAGTILLRNRHGRLRLTQTWGPKPLWEPARRSHAARAARQQVLTTSATRYFRLPRLGQMPAQVRAWALPLRAQDRVIGVLEVYGADLAPRSEDETLLILADQAAGALERARLYQELAERERRLEDLVRRLFLAQEEERRSVAYDIHDGLAQLALASQEHLEAFTSHYHPRSERARDELCTALELIARTVREARRVIAGLRPRILDDSGLAQAISTEVQVLRDEGWQIEYTCGLGLERLPPLTETALFRVVQEALSNVKRHAHTKRVTVSIQRQRLSVHLEVRDWGRGFRLANVLAHAGPSERVGLAGMQERIALLRGHCTIRSRPGAGTRVIVEVPVVAPVCNTQADA